MMYEARLFQHKNGTDHLALNGKADLEFNLNSKSGALDLGSNPAKVRLLTGKPGNKTPVSRQTDGILAQSSTNAGTLLKTKLESELNCSIGD